MANREAKAKANRQMGTMFKREVGTMLSRETKSMLKNVTSVVMSALLATTVFLGGLGAYNPEPAHAATYTYTLTANAAVGSSTTQGEIWGITIDGQSFSQTGSNGWVTVTAQVDSAPTTVKVNVGGPGARDNVSLSPTVTDGVEKTAKGKSGSYQKSVKYKSTLTANHTHTWNNNSYSASGNKITATCQGSGTCDLTQPTLTLNASGKTYDGSVVTASLTKSSTWSSQGLTTPTITYSPANSKNVGTYTASVKVGNATATQSFTISPKTVGLTWGTSTFNYDGNSHVPTATATGLVSGDTCNVTVEGAQTNADTYTATAASLSNSNYALPSAKTKNFTIAPKSIDVTGVVAKDKDYDGNTTASFDLSAAGLSGVVGTDDVSVGSVTGNFADKNAGADKPITASAALTGAAAGNYTPNPVSGLKAKIHHLATEVNGITASNKVYDGTTDATVDTSGATFTNMVEGDKLSISATGKFEDPNVGEGKTVNLTLGDLAGDDAGNYLFDKSDSQQTAKANITAKPMTVGATGYEAEYDSNAHSIAVNVTDPAEGYTITYKGPKDADYSASNPSFTDPGTYEVAYKVVAPNYADFTGTATVKIIGADFKGITAESYDGIYDAAEHGIAVSVPSEYQPYTITYSTSEDGDYSTTPITYKDFTEGAKTVYYKVSKTGYNDYKSSATVTIAQKEVGLEWGEAAFTYDGTAKLPALTLTGVESGDSCEATVEGEQTNANVKSGTDKYTATATALSNNNYKLPASTTKDFTIAQKEVGLTWGSTDLIYTSEMQAPEVTAQGVLDGDTCDVIVAGKEVYANAKTGTEKYTATASGLYNKNYKIAAGAEISKDYTIAQKVIVVNGITSLGKKYDGNTDATASLYYEDEHLIGMIDGDDLDLEATGTFDDKNVGTDKVITLTNLTLTGDDKDNYVLAQAGQQQTTFGNITEYEVSVTAKNAEKFYGELDPTFEFDYTPDLIEGDKFEGALSRHEGEEAGTYTITAGSLHDQNKNYAIKYTHGTLTIKQATTNSVEASIEGWTYGNEPSEPTATGTFGADTATFSYSTSKDGTYTADVPVNAGTYFVKATVATTKNYVGAESEPVEFEIAKKRVELEWKDTELVYNGTPQKPTATAKDLVGEDKCDVTVEGAKTDSNAKTGTDSYTAEAKSLSNPNYALPEQTTTEFTIAQAEITVSGITAEGKTYDGKTDAVLKYDSVELDGKVGSEDLGITATGTFEDKNAGNKKVEISDLELTGADKDNYVLAAEGQQTETTATINQLPITVTAEEKTKYYGEDDPELTYTVDPKLIEGDEFEGALEREAGEDVEDYTIYRGTLSAGGNYDLSYVPSMLEILKASNSVEAELEGWTYGSEPNDPVANAKFGADTATFTYSSAADGTYTEAVPTEAGTYFVKAAIDKTSNYEGATSEPVEFVIAQKEAGLEWGGTAFTYNGGAQKPSVNVTGLVGEDVCMVNVSGEQTDANAKTGTESYTATATALSNPNYVLPSNASTSFTIAPKPITSEMLGLDKDTIKNNGSKQGPAITMTDGTALVAGEDYTVSGEATSAANGTHNFTVTGAGNYTGSIESSWYMYENKQNTASEEGKDGAGNIEVFIDVIGNTESINVTNFTVDFAKGLLSEEELNRRAEGANITLYVEVAEVASGSIPEINRVLLRELFEGKSAKDIRWFDITVWKKVGNDPATQLHELNSALEMTIDVPSEYKDVPENTTRTFYFATIHNGLVKTLAETTDKAVSFSTKDFSTFALAYKDVKASDPGNDGKATKSPTKAAKTTAKTADGANLPALTGLALLSALLLAVAATRRRKEEEAK